ncbi:MULTISPECIES: DegT/DnrJ/EryC1/StrS family aminotransferase [Nocardiopsis]|uniref:Aminotransferase DegT n=1 Tax=Nocardiopsis sinuspersici TaxID=501010 RepID=A0A1V3BXP5_9ACTN|nr:MULTISPECIES: DegT/DnrJ/EryC1/StrS family aminotransferase [Nocardiopsis]OOC53331.1 aminotransferase DegT [Nocardiopsis sinuspersici]
MIPLFKVAMSEEAPDRVAEVLRCGQLEHGPRVEEFEAALSERLGNPLVTAVNCGTSGLHLALSLVAGQYGGSGGAHEDTGEVLATPLTFEGTNWPILAHGMRIRWVDVDPETLNMDLDDLERKISPSTKAIMVVHWLGYPVDLDRLRGIVDRAERRLGFRPPVIEDCAQAWGATYRGLPLGNHGNTCVYSFQAIKLLTCGGGGLVVLPEEELHRRAVLRRWFGIDRAADRVHGDYDVPEWGFRFPMNDTAAAVGLANLDIVDPLLARHRENAAHYDKELAGVPGVELTERADDREPSFWAYPLKVEDRDAFTRKLAERGIMTSLISRRNDEHTCVAPYRSELPGLDRIQDRIIYVPVGWWLTEEDRSHIVDVIRSGW